MEILLSILVVPASFILFAEIFYFLVKAAFPKIENDDWEERYVEMKKNTERFNQLRSRRFNQKAVN